MNTMSANRKPRGYLATVKRDLDDARKALAERTRMLTQAEARLEKERAKRPDEPPPGQPISQSVAESLWERNRPFFEAEGAVKELATEVRELEGTVRKLSVIVEAPDLVKSTGRRQLSCPAGVNYLGRL